MPVWEERPDNVIGLVNSKELLYLFTANAPVVLDDLLYPPTFLDPEINIADALHLLRKTHKHMAVVREKSGVVLGLITLEDVLEEICPEDIEDEHDVRQAKLHNCDGSGHRRKTSAARRSGPRTRSFVFSGLQLEHVLQFLNHRFQFLFPPLELVRRGEVAQHFLDVVVQLRGFCLGVAG